MAQTAGAVGIATFAVPAVGVIILFHVLFEKVSAHGAKLFGFFKFGHEVADGEHAPDAEELPVAFAISLGGLLEGEPSPCT